MTDASRWPSSSTLSLGVAGDLVKRILESSLVLSRKGVGATCPWRWISGTEACLDGTRKATVRWFICEVLCVLTHVGPFCAVAKLIEINLMNSSKDFIQNWHPLLGSQGIAECWWKSSLWTGRVGVKTYPDKLMYPQGLPGFMRKSDLNFKSQNQMKIIKSLRRQLNWLQVLNTAVQQSSGRRNCWSGKMGKPALKNMEAVVSLLYIWGECRLCFFFKSGIIFPVKQQ